MKAELPKPIHESYRRHRSQLTSQIIMPIVLVVLLFVVLVVLIVLATFRGGGDAARWAEISTIWIAIPVMIASLIFLVLLAGMIYLLARLLGIAPIYTGRAQDFVRRLSMRIEHAADLPVRPILFLNGIGASIKALLGRK